VVKQAPLEQPVQLVSLVQLDQQDNAVKPAPLEQPAQLETLETLGLLVLLVTLV